MDAPWEIGQGTAGRRPGHRARPGARARRAGRPTARRCCWPTPRPAWSAPAIPGWKGAPRRRAGGDGGGDAPPGRPRAERIQGGDRPPASPSAPTRWAPTSPPPSWRRTRRNAQVSSAPRPAGPTRPHFDLKGYVARRLTLAGVGRVQVLPCDTCAEPAPLLQLPSRHLERRARLRPPALGHRPRAVGAASAHGNPAVPSAGHGLFCARRYLRGQGRAGDVLDRRPRRRPTSLSAGSPRPGAPSPSSLPPGRATPPRRPPRPDRGPSPRAPT